MPATEQTWRNLKTMHLVFGLSSLAMLVVTVLLLAADNVREWKVYQRQFRALETWSADSRVTEARSSEGVAKSAQLREALQVIRETPLDPQLVAKFLAAARFEQLPEVDRAPLQKKAAYKLSELNAWVQQRRQEVEAESRGQKIAGKLGPETAAKRSQVVGQLQEIFQRAKFLEDQTQSALKFQRADLDVVMSQYSLGVDEGKSAAELAAIQKNIDAVKDRVERLNVEYQGLRAHRLQLQDALAEVVASETAAVKAIDDAEGDLRRFQLAYTERKPNLGKSILESPILDAFGRPLKIEQIWLPQLTLNNNFKEVARFDRCTTCHQGIEKTAPGSAVLPGYEDQHRLTLALATPEADPHEAPSEQAAESKEPAKSTEVSTHSVYGMILAPQGVFAPNDATIEVVFPASSAAKAGLLSGDVIEWINDVKITDRSKAINYLLSSVKWGQPLKLGIRRGTPQPFSSHPRLDLFVGSLSPHKMGDFGCTICHEGQGSATQFKWVSHTPNTPNVAAQWQSKYGWFNNHHWIFPMRPERFAEASCLKCHHDMNELEPSARFPDPPAPKLMAGYHLIREIGCFGCHEINGYDGPNKRRGPDLRVEPGYASYAGEVLSDKQLPAELRGLATEVVDHPDRVEPRRLLAERILSSEKKESFSPTTLKMASLLAAEDEAPGRLRKVGPSLRYVDRKVDLKFVYDWVREPRNFRPSTKMPQFFGLHDHLQPDALDAKVEKGKRSGLEVAQAYEPVEIRAVAHYLLEAAKGEVYDAPSAPAGVTEKPSVERGKEAFQTRGCLACHKHPDFPKAQDNQGPELSRLGSKLVGEKGRKWLEGWLRKPTQYHARTNMPNLFLEPVKQADGKVVDPAADIAAFLLASQGWDAPELPSVNDVALSELVGQYLKGVFTQVDSDRYRERGIPAERATSVPADERVLVMQPGDNESTLRDRKLFYLGKKTINRLGCAGCHDIPGFEDAKSIGTGLADWGRKEPAKLAFEQIATYLANKGSHSGHDSHGGEGSHGGHGSGHSVEPRHMKDQNEAFFLASLHHHEREGFLWQKLREPRSYDYKKTENKDYIDRLRMPQFNLNEEQREAIMTFVLGLVAEPPAAQYVYQPSPRQKAIQQGHELLVQFNCVGCHTIDQETWTFDFDPAKFENPPPLDMAKEYHFIQPHFTPEELARSKVVDRRGLAQAVVTGVPNPVKGEDPDTEKPLYYFAPWKPVAINGQVWTVGGSEIPILEDSITNRRPPFGGDLARLLHPVVLANEKKANPNAKDSDAWGWVPPPLVGQGIKVRPEWFYEFLLEPYPIRPAVVLRMPKFNLSSEQARVLVDYFAAKDNAEYPYEFDARKWSQFTQSEASQVEQIQRLDGALKLITDNNYCVKCHLVGDFRPAGSIAALAPQLDRVAERLRPAFLQQWLAKPSSLLPYTGMPVNFPRDKAADQALLTGSAEEQMQTVVDLLLNWSNLMKQQTANSIKARVKPPPPAADAAPATGAED